MHHSALSRIVCPVDDLLPRSLVIPAAVIPDAPMVNVGGFTLTRLENGQVWVNGANGSSGFFPPQVISALIDKFMEGSKR